MNPLRTLMAVLAAFMLGGGRAAPARAMPVVVETVTVGNPGNPGETIQFQGVFGAVGHVYAVGKYEVTAGQYAAFLNAVAATDTYALYNVKMWTHDEGCRIERAGSPGSYTYGVAPDWANRPVNFVSWGDAVRFANWLHNDQPAGAQGPGTTEDGSYYLNGKTSDNDLEAVTREPDATWVIPTENEWFKAAYHKNDGVTGNYWNYPTAADNGVSHLLIDPDPGNNATFSGGTYGDWTIGAPYYRTEAGAHESTTSAYGAFDMGGNVQEFNETVPEPDIRGIRGGSWYWGNILGNWDRPIDMHSSDQFSDLGFRVANVATGSVAVPPSDPGPGLRFSILGPHPIRTEARFRVELPEAGRVRVDFFDVAGRRVTGGIDVRLPAGVNVVSWKPDGLVPGIYLARVTAQGGTLGLRLVLLR